MYLFDDKFTINLLIELVELHERLEKIYIITNLCLIINLFTGEIHHSKHGLYPKFSYSSRIYIILCKYYVHSDRPILWKNITLHSFG